MEPVTKERKKQLFKEFGNAESNTGSIEAQIALFTERINHISAHLKTNKKDFSTQRALLQLVGKRKKALKYLAKTDITAYRSLLEKLNLRK